MCSVTTESSSPPFSLRLILPLTMQRNWSTTSNDYTKSKTESTSLSLQATLNLFNGFSDYASLKAALSEKNRPATVWQEPMKQ